MNIKSIISVLLSVLTLVSFLGLMTGCDNGADTSDESNVTSVEVSSTESKNDDVSSKEEKPSSKKPSSKPASSEKEPEIKYTEKEKIYYGMDPELYKLGLANAGDSSRIASLMKKAEKGGKYKIAVLGGSISQGAGASSQYSCYGNLVCEWWISNFPNAEFEFINGGIGSSNAEMATYRMEADVLAFKPDFVMVDFTVNTYLDSDTYRSYSTILYKLLSQKNSPAVMSIHFTSCDRKKHDLAGQYVKASGGLNGGIVNAIKDYNIPAMDYGKYVWEKINKKVIRWPDIGDDYIHPNDNGHMVAANLITAHLEKVKAGLKTASTKITAPKMPDDPMLINVGYIINTAKGVKVSGDFVANSNETATTRGWKYAVGGATDSALTLSIPENRGVKLFMRFNDGSSGQLNVTDSTGKTTPVHSDSAKTPTLVELGAMSGTITIKPQLSSGGFTIFGIAYDKK